jgi:hypothetical protein
VVRKGRDSDAYDNGYRGGYGQYGYNDNYAARNGFVCQPAPGSRAKTAVAISASKSAQKTKAKKAIARPPFLCPRLITGCP